MDKIKKSLLSKKNGKAEIICFIIYITGIVFMSFFHELWFDEAQAWLIAKSASYKDMLTVIPHYEGHPPLWHLFLSIFAKNGFPYELTIKTINCVFMFVNVALLLFKSPFNKLIKCTLPFTYFIFFQYGLNCRPYCIFILAIFLSAITYKNRNTHPMKYILSLLLMCLSTAYGLTIACGLCIAWTIEIVNELIKENRFKYVFKDKRFYSLWFILICSILIAITIIPADDVLLGADNETSFLDNFKNFKRYLLMIIMPVENWWGITLNGDDNVYSTVTLITIEVIVGIFIWCTLIVFSKINNKLLEFVLPSLFQNVFLCFGYMASHHIGIGAVFHIFYFWIILQNETIIYPKYILRLKSIITSNSLKKSLSFFCGIIYLIPVMYSIVASVTEIKHNSGCAVLADFIKENHLEKKKIMVKWAYISEDNDIEKDKLEDILSRFEMPSEHAQINTHFTNLTGAAVQMLPYFDGNIFTNHNILSHDDLYMHWQKDRNTEEIFELWRNQGLPDFIIDYCPIDEVYSDAELNNVKYLPIYETENYCIYKTTSSVANDTIFIREDLLDEFPQFHWIYDPKADIYEIKH